MQDGQVKFTFQYYWVKVNVTATKKMCLCVLVRLHGPRNVPGNAIADGAAKQAAALEFIGPEMVFRTSRNTVQNKILSWASLEHRNLW